MRLPDENRGLADRIVARLDRAREFCVHSRQAWRLVQKLAEKGRPVGIVDLASSQQLPSLEIESRSQSYVTALGESVYKELSSLLEDWILGLIRIWLSAYPEDLDLNFDPANGQRRGRKQEEVPFSPFYPLSRFGSARPDPDAPCYLRRPSPIMGEGDLFGVGLLCYKGGPRCQEPSTTHRVRSSRPIGMRGLAITPMEPSAAKSCRRVSRTIWRA
jgi:hypothetical protein